MRQYHSAGRRAQTTTWMLRGLAVIAVMASVLWITTPADATQAGVHALFALSQPSDSPFPTNWHTVNDASNLTGIRVNLPVPDCSVRPSDCDDVAVLNSLDGFNLQPRVSIPFDGTIDLIPPPAATCSWWISTMTRSSRSTSWSGIPTPPRSTSNPTTYCASTPVTRSS